MTRGTDGTGAPWTPIRVGTNVRPRWSAPVAESVPARGVRTTERSAVRRGDAALQRTEEGHRRVVDTKQWGNVRDRTAGDQPPQLPVPGGQGRRRRGARRCGRRRAGGVRLLHVGILLDVGPVRVQARRRHGVTGARRVAVGGAGRRDRRLLPAQQPLGHQRVQLRQRHLRPAVRRRRRREHPALPVPVGHPQFDVRHVDHGPAPERQVPRRVRTHLRGRGRQLPGVAGVTPDRPGAHRGHLVHRHRPHDGASTSCRRRTPGSPPGSPPRSATSSARP